jgi:methionyl aminopeptidase
MVRTSEEIDKMRIVGRLTGQVLEALNDFIQPGITTGAIDRFCEDYIINTLHAIPGSKGQYGYLYTVNTSPNNVICHGMPYPELTLKSGDIINVDVTVLKDGLYGDSSKTYCVGAVVPYVERLVRVTQECLYKAIAVVKPGATLGDIGHTIQRHAEQHSYSVVREYCGHGIGRKMHQEPQ